MPKFQINNTPPPIVNKPKPKIKQPITNPPVGVIRTKGRFQVTDNSYYDKDIGDPNRRVLRGKEDYHIEFNCQSLDGIHISSCGRFGIKYSNEFTYTLYHFKKPLEGLGEKQQLLLLRTDLDYDIFIFKDKNDDVILGYIKTKLHDIILKTRYVNTKTKKIEVNNSLIEDENVNLNLNESEIDLNVQNNSNNTGFGETTIHTIESRFKPEVDNIELEEETYKEPLQKEGEGFQEEEVSFKEIDKREEVEPNRKSTGFIVDL
jgi:hypothetical protein